MATDVYQCCFSKRIWREFEARSTSRRSIIGSTSRRWLWLLLLEKWNHVHNVFEEDRHSLCSRSWILVVQGKMKDPFLYSLAWLPWELFENLQQSMDQQQPTNVDRRHLCPREQQRGAWLWRKEAKFGMFSKSWPGLCFESGLSTHQRHRHCSTSMETWWSDPSILVLLLKIGRGRCESNSVLLLDYNIVLNIDQEVWLRL